MRRFVIGFLLVMILVVAGCSRNQPPQNDETEKICNDFRAMMDNNAAGGKVYMKDGYCIIEEKDYATETKFICNTPFSIYKVQMNVKAGKDATQIAPKECKVVEE